ncbi:MAG: Dabb family protein [Pseudomonadales bacterium]
MFRHCVMFRWKPETTAAQKATLFAALDGLVNLEVVRAFAHGPDAGLREGNWDHVVVADFDDSAGYQVYAAHPQHVQIIQTLLMPAIADRAAVQYAIGG